MDILERGKVKDGAIVLDRPLKLEDGTDVEVRIQPLGPQPSGEHEEDAGPAEDFASLPFFGMWADREDMADSVEWVNKERAKWHSRSHPRD